MKLKGALSYAIVLLFLVWSAFAFRADLAQITFAPIWAAKGAIFIAVLLSLTNYALRVVRWSLYLSKLGYPLPLGFSGLTYIAGFAFTLSPGKVGEIVRGRYYQKMGIPMTSSVAAFFMERLMDLLAMLALAFLAVASSSAYNAVILGTVVVIVLLFALLALAPWVRISSYMESADRLPKSIKNVTQGLLRTLLSAKVLLNPQLLAIGFVIGLIAWGAEGLGLLAITAIFPDIAIDWPTAIGIYSVAIIVGALSFLPGGLGGTEAVMIALLAAHGYPLPQAILLTFVCRLVTLWLAVVIGWIAVASLRRNPMLKKASP